MSRNRRLTTSPHEHKRGPNGRRLCRWCGVEVTPPRLTFCSDACVHEWRLRSDPGYLRDQVFQRDHGVCARCGTDTEALRRELHAVRAEQGWEAWNTRARELSGRLSWEAHHIAPVVEGGGECDLDNLQTLCRACHKAETAALAKRRSRKR